MPQIPLQYRACTYLPIIWVRCARSSSAVGHHLVAVGVGQHDELAEALQPYMHRTGTKETIGQVPYLKKVMHSGAMIFFRRSRAMPIQGL